MCNPRAARTRGLLQGVAAPGGGDIIVLSPERYSGSNDIISTRLGGLEEIGPVV